MKGQQHGGGRYAKGARKNRGWAVSMVNCEIAAGGGRLCWVENVGRKELTIKPADEIGSVFD